MKSQLEHMQKRIEQLTAVQEQADPAGKLKIFTDRIKELESKLAASQAETKVFRDESAVLKKRPRNSDSAAEPPDPPKIPKIEMKSEKFFDSLIKSNEELANAMKDFGFMIDAVLADAGAAVCRLLNDEKIKVESPPTAEVTDESSNGGGADNSLTADIDTY